MCMSWRLSVTSSRPVAVGATYAGKGQGKAQVGSAEQAESAAAAALREAEAAILAAEQAQKTALEELHRKNKKQQHISQQKKGWF